MRSHRYFPPAACLLVLSACSGGGEPANDGSSDHVWKAQENAYRKAQEVAPMLDETDRRRRELMEEQGG
jgi:hypothetical protein